MWGRTSSTSEPNLKSSEDNKVIRFHANPTCQLIIPIVDQYIAECKYEIYTKYRQISCGLRCYYIVRLHSVKVGRG